MNNDLNKILDKISAKILGDFMKNPRDKTITTRKISEDKTRSIYENLSAENVDKLANLVHACRDDFLSEKYTSIKTDMINFFLKSYGDLFSNRISLIFESTNDDKNFNCEDLVLNEIFTGFENIVVPEILSIAISILYNHLRTDTNFENYINKNKYLEIAKYVALYAFEQNIEYYWINNDGFFTSDNSKEEKKD
jgi:hypothetical protein